MGRSDVVWCAAWRGGERAPAEARPSPQPVEPQRLPMCSATACDWLQPGVAQGEAQHRLRRSDPPKMSSSTAPSLGLGRLTSSRQKNSKPAGKWSANASTQMPFKLAPLLQTLRPTTFSCHQLIPVPPEAPRSSPGSSLSLLARSQSPSPTPSARPSPQSQVPSPGPGNPQLASLSSVHVDWGAATAA